MAKKPKKLTKKKLLKMERTAKRKAMKAWSLHIRTRDGKCVVCGATKNLDAAHLLGRERYQEYQIHPMNGLALCKIHHKFGRASCHLGIFWFVEWVKQNKPEHYEWVMKQLELCKDLPATTPQLKAPSNAERLDSDPTASN